MHLLTSDAGLDQRKDASMLLYSCLVWISKFFRKNFSSTFVVIGKICPTMNYLGSKDSSRYLHTNCAISYFFTYI
jgi:hypothetical protein